MEKIAARDPVATAADLKEIVELGALDGELYSRTFFPKTFRQPNAPFHRDMWQLLDSTHRQINMQVFRDGAKTTICRAYTSKRIAYGLARNILYIGKSEAHALRSIAWLRRQVEFNKVWAQTFGLRKGSRWTDEESEIIHEVEGASCWILGMGITGSVRGINRDDYRPDLIVLDDIVDEENAATVDQRNKINNLIYGAVARSLAPASENPDAKIVALQTPLNKEDYSTLATRDPEWVSRVYSCWTRETQDARPQAQESSWPARRP